VKRAGCLKRYIDEVSDLESRARRVREEMLGHEIRVMVTDGMPPLISPRPDGALAE
jgi:hypothetical protein